jgi:dTDP-4-amino-4,6-dideoxygalactose transaminase
MNRDRIYLAPPNVELEEIQEVTSVFESGWIAPLGPHVDLFEKQLENHFQNRRVLTLNSGSSALHLALILAGVSVNDEVVIGSFTFASCANAVLYQRGVPVFMDSENVSWNLDPDLLEGYLSTCEQKPKAVIVTHLYGVPARIKELRDICNNYHIILIEDAAEAMGSTFMDQQTGSFGEYGVVSFNGNKIITTGGGGALITDEENYERGLHLASQANNDRFGYDHDELGYNYRMSNVLAGIGVAQCSKLDAFISKKREIYDNYQSNLSSDLFSFLPEPEGCYCNRWLSTPLFNSPKENPLELIKYLDKNNIEARRLWKPLHLHSAFKRFKFVGSGVAEKIFNQGLCLPSGTGLTKDDQDYIIEKIRQFLL